MKKINLIGAGEKLIDVKKIFFYYIMGVYPKFFFIPYAIRLFYSTKYFSRSEKIFETSG